MALLLTLCGCARHAEAPTPIPVETTQSAAQQARTARTEATRLYQQKAYARARVQALLAMGLLKLDGTDPKGVKAMRLLAAKAGAHARDPAAAAELRELAQDKALDAEGKQLAAALPAKTPTPPPVNPVNVSHAPAPDATATGNSESDAAQDAHDLMRSHRPWRGQ